MFNEVDLDFFPWGPLPYPKDHAMKALQLYREGKKEEALKMAAWQKRTLDHDNEPIFSLFCQEGTLPLAEIQEANKRLFSEIDVPSQEKIFFDPDCGLAGKKEDGRTILTLSAGCKSGIGVYLYHDAGVVNYGPTLLPLGECEGFGIAGKGRDESFHETEQGYRFSFLNRVAYPHEREKNGMKDSGYSGLWISAATEVIGDVLDLKITLEGFRPLKECSFVFFGKGEACVVAGSQKLRPRSLDRYLGPSNYLEFRGKNGKVLLREVSGSSKMEVIPLAGGDSFWGADFLVAFSFERETLNFTLRSYP